MLSCRSNLKNLTKNFIIDPSGIFSGNGPTFANNVSFEKVEDNGPVVRGSYHLTKHESKPHFWRLKPDVYTFMKIKLLGRYGGFQLHPGGVSQGCITVDQNNASAVKAYKIIETQ